MGFDFDFVVVGSGFGGSVSACRLAEKGYSVAVIEMGKRWCAEDFPRTNWNLRRFLWMPRLFMHGIQQITMLRDVLVFHGAGVGGGSLVYANTLLEPPDEFYKDPKWADLGDWKATLAPHYATAKRMLGVTEAKHLGVSDELLREIARDMGREHTFHRTNVAVYFGEPGVTHPDPYFGGEGPPRTGCTLCGGCMVGCRHGAKNTLDKNYLWFAEKRGAQVIPETRVTDLRKVPGGWEVHVESSTALLRKNRRVITARNVVLSAGVLGTVRLLMRCQARGSLALPPALGKFVRTNSEALLGVRAKKRDVDYSKGIAISAGFYPDEKTHIETVRYPEGSDFMALLGTVLVGGGPPWPRPLRFLAAMITRPLQTLRLLWPFGFARKTTILLCMQPVDNSLELRMRRKWWWPFRRTVDSDLGARTPAPTFIPIANETAERLAKRKDGIPASVLPEVLFDLSSTAHILGGCPIGHGPEDGVVDASCRVFGHEGLWVIDGSVIPANLGVNPSLTITALAEHAMSRIPAAAPERQAETKPAPSPT